MKKFLLLAVVCLGITTVINAQDIDSDLVFYLKIDNSTFVDEVNGLTGIADTVTMYPTPVEGFDDSPAGAALFSGEQALRFTDSLIVGLPLERDSRTMAVWMKTDSLTKGDFMAWGKKGRNSHNHFVYNAEEGNDRVELGHWNADVHFPITTSELSDGNWHHFVVTEGETRVKLYIDGVEMGDEEKNADFSTTLGVEGDNGHGDFRVGSRNIDYPATKTPFKGALDEVRVYKRELSADDVAELFAYLPPITSISESKFGAGSFKVYPTIVESTLNISSDMPINSVKIINISGVVVLESSMQNTIDVSSLNRGLYFISATYGQQKYSAKFIKK